VALADRVRQVLPEWRERSGNDRAKVVFIAHSMGGLVARYYADVLGGAEDTRALITIGTPYQGSVNAAVTLTRGVAPALGSLADPLTRVSRSLPSIHQLLPRYRCLLDAAGNRVSLDSGSMPGIDPRLAACAARLHTDLERAAPPEYAVHAFGGYRQPTGQSVRLAAKGLDAMRELDGEDHRGDGTVPRFSCFPPAWTDDSAVRFFAQRHSTLQNEPALLNQIEAILTARDPREFLDGRVELAADLPEIAPRLVAPVAVETEDDRLSLGAFVENVETGDKLSQTPLRGSGDGSYGGWITFPESGTWRVTIRDVTPANRVHPVTDFILATAGDDLPV
jgi:pimeloyl-ACP methyl ester carboxylesterase